MTGGRILSVWRVGLAALVALAASMGDARAQQSLEDAVKATFLYRFGSFANWPPSAFADNTTPLVICIAGDAAFAQLVEHSAGAQQIGGRALSVRRLSIVSPASGCHILYIALSSPQAIRDALQATTGDPVLTVTDARFGSVRGAIHFAQSEGRVRFHIDRRAAQRNGVTLSSRLLNIAISVEGAEG